MDWPILSALIWLPILGVGLVLWAEEEAAKKVEKEAA